MDPEAPGIQRAAPDISKEKKNTSKPMHWRRWWMRPCVLADARGGGDSPLPAQGGEPPWLVVGGDPGHWTPLAPQEAGFAATGGQIR